jgi:hypothetical protein
VFSDSDDFYEQDDIASPLFEVKNKKHHQLDFDAKKERRQFI